MGTMLKSAAAPLASHLPHRFRGVRGLISAIVGLMVTWEQRLKDRETLRVMSAQQLRDIGLDVGTAAREAEKPFWRA